MIRERLERVVDRIVHLITHKRKEPIEDPKEILPIVKEAMPASYINILESVPNRFQSPQRAYEWMCGYVTIRAISKLRKDFSHARDIINFPKHMPEMDVFVKVSNDGMKIDRMYPRGLDEIEFGKPIGELS